MQASVRDTGIGIRAEDIPKLFQSFQRLDEERNHNIEGTGLGIAIVQKLLSMMDSKLNVTSVYGKSSEFSFNLVQKVIDKSPIGDYKEKHFKKPNSSAQKNFLLAAGAKILVVDDNDMNLKVISGLLKRNRIVPDLAYSGHQCLKLAAKNFYHIIFLDNMMPVMNGIETLHTLRREKILSGKTSVIMLTANAIAGMREKYLREGFDDYLSKPIDVGELESILERHLPTELVNFDIEYPTTATPDKPVKAPDVPDNASQMSSATVEPYSAQTAFSDTEDNINILNTIDKNTSSETVSNSNYPTKKSPVTETTDKPVKASDVPDNASQVPSATAIKRILRKSLFQTQKTTQIHLTKLTEKIQAAFDSSDVKNYQILVHALKSTSLSIGAENLSKQAKHLELAAKADDLATIQAGYTPLMATYRNVREQIAHWLEAST